MDLSKVKPIEIQKNTSPSRLDKLLPWNGSHLGKHNFLDVVLWYYPISTFTHKGVTPVCVAYIKWNDVNYPVILKKNHRISKTDQVIVDQLKPLFGLVKMGTHRIRLHGSIRKHRSDAPWVYPNGASNCEVIKFWEEYLIFPATMEIADGDRKAFKILKSMDQYEMPNSKAHVTDEHRRVYQELKKILMFRELMRVKNTTLDRILIRDGTLISTDEMVILKPDDMLPKTTYENFKLSTELENLCFPLITSRGEVLSKMCNLTKENYMAELAQLQEAIKRTIIEIDETKLWLADLVFDRMKNLIHDYWTRDWS